MAELIGDLFRGDSWNMPGGKDTQILHTHSEDMSSDSPTQGKVEEQSSFKRSVASEQARHADRTRPCSTYSATLATARVSPIAEAATIAPVDAANGQMPVSNSSNSSACCMPSFGAQAGPSYDINASAQTAEQLLSNNSPRQAQAAQYNAPFPGNNMPGSFQPRKILPDSVVQSLMASVFDDVDSGRHQQAESELPQSRHGRLPMHRHGVVQQDSLPSAYRSFFPAEDPPMLQSQQQLREYQLTQLLPPQLQGRQRPQHAPQQHVHQQPGLDHQQMGFSALGLQQPVNGASPQRMPSDMQHWPSPVSQHASPGSSVQAHRNPPGHQQIKLEDLDLSGLKRDYSSFTGPTSQSRQPRPGPAPRRALSFTHGSPAIAVSTAASSAARQTQGVATSSQVNTNSRLSTPAPNVTSPADTDASLSDSDDMSGSDSGGVHIKRRRLVKGKRGAGRRPRRMVCKNCGAHQTPQWRCGPEGPRTLCNACGVRYKKGLPLNGTGKFAEGGSS